MQINTKKLKKLIIKAVPYVIFSYAGNLIGYAYRTAEGDGFQEKILPFMSNLGVAFAKVFPSLHPLDILFGLVLAGVMRLVLYIKSKNRKKFRQGEEYGSAVWGTEKDIEPYMDNSCPENNVILTKTEFLTMGRPSSPKYARNKNILVIGGSGSGKTRFFVKPNLMQMHSSYVVTDPKGTVLVECGEMLRKGRPKRKDGKIVYATRVVQRKADDIRKAFKNWIFRDADRRENIVQRYNELFNSIRPREFDGSAISFPMMTADIKLHDHQKNAIAHALFGGNTLFAHCVGAGKTFEMIATAMESKRLGLCTKSLFAVPNHLTEQIGDDFQKLYPGANILVATKKDFQKANRQQLFAKIATGNYDAVIIGHSQLGMIPVSKERQTMTIQTQIDDILQGIEELKKNEGSKFQIKAMERTRKSLQKQLDKLQKMNQDNTLTFEQLGVDRLFIDEAHEFKNLFVSTKMQNVAGISNSASQKALDLFLKCQYLDEKTGGKGIIFATGTPYASPYQH